MRKILITGVAGLLGSRLADWIINNTNYKVVGIDDLSGGFSENINRNVEFYKFNLILVINIFNNVSSILC